MTLINKTAKKDAQAKRTNRGSLLATKRIEFLKLRLGDITSTRNCEGILKAMLNNEAASKNRPEKLVVAMGIYADKKDTATGVFDELVKARHGDIKKATSDYNRAKSYKNKINQTAIRGSERGI